MPMVGQLILDINCGILKHFYLNLFTTFLDINKYSNLPANASCLWTSPSDLNRPFMSRFNMFTINDDEVREQKKDNRNKNYAPITIPTNFGLKNVVQDLTYKPSNIFQHRQQLLAQKYQQYLKVTVAHKSDYMPKTITSDIAQRRQNLIDKRHNIVHVAIRNPLTYFLPNISPILNPYLKQYGTGEQRMVEYSRKHKCMHGLRYNLWSIETVLHEWTAEQKKTKFYEDIKTIKPGFAEDNRWGYQYFQLNCDHHLESVEHATLDGTKYCPSCNRRTYLKINRDCACKWVTRCSYCKYSQYTFSDSNGETKFGFSCGCGHKGAKSEEHTENIKKFLQLNTVSKRRSRKWLKELNGEPRVKLGKTWAPIETTVQAFSEVVAEEENQLTHNINRQYRIAKAEGGALSGMSNQLKTLQNKTHSFVNHSKAFIEETFKSVITGIKDMLEKFKHFFGGIVEERLVDRFKDAMNKIGRFLEVVLTISTPLSSLALIIDNIVSLFQEGVSIRRLVMLFCAVHTLGGSAYTMSKGIEYVKIKENRERTLNIMIQDMQQQHIVEVEKLRELLNLSTTLPTSSNNELLELVSRQSEELIELRHKFKRYVDAATELGEFMRKGHPEEAAYNAIFGELLELDGTKSESGEPLIWKFLSILSRFFGFDEKNYSFFTACKNYNLLSTACKNTFDFITLLFDYLPSFLKDLVGFRNHKLWLQTQLTNPESHWAKAMANALAAGLAATRYQLEKRDQYVIQMKVEIEHCKEQAAKAGMQYSTDIKKFFDTMDKAIMAHASKTEKKAPFVIKLTGLAGVGKSTLWPILAGSIYQDMSIKQILAATFSRNATSEYWDGYNKDTKIVLYDDFGQSREELDFGELIHLVSAADFQASFGSVDPSSPYGVKGMIVNPELVVLLSNSTVHMPTTINDQNALNRRRNVHLTLNKKLEEGQTLEDLVFDAIECRDSSTEIIFHSLTLDEARSFIKQQYDEYHKKQEDIVIDLESYSGITRPVIPFERRSKRPDWAAPRLVPLIKTTLMNNKAEDSFTIKPSKKIDNSAKTEVIVDNFVDAVETQRPAKTESGLDILVGLVAASFATHKAFETLVITYHMPQTIKQLWSDILNNPVRASLATICAAVVAVGSSIVVFKTLRSMFASSESGEAPTGRIRRVVKSEGGTEDMIQLVANNTVRLISESGETNAAIFISGNIILVNRHFFFDNNGKYILNGTSFFIRSDKQAEDFEISFDLNNLEVIKSKLGEKDAVLYKLPARIPSRKSLIKHFTNGDISLTGRDAVTIKISSTGTTTPVYTKIVKDQKRLIVEEKGIFVEYHDTFLYDYRSQAGECGQAILLDDNLVTDGKIVGIHCAGNGYREAHANIITKANLEIALRLLERGQQVPSLAHSQTGYYQELNGETAKDVGLKGQISLIAKSNLTVYPPHKTSLRPSVLYNKIHTATTEPAILWSKDPRADGEDIYLKGVNKYATPSGQFPSDLADEAIESVKEEFLGIKGIFIKRKLSTFEAINGIPTIPYMDALDMSTSAGAPFVYDPESKGEKRKLFDSEYSESYKRVVYTPKARLQQLIEQYESTLEGGEIPFLPYIDYLKDERRPIEKIRQKKTRLFSACSVVQTIVERKYLLGFMSMFYQARNQLFSQVGINKGSTQWDDFTRYLMEVSEEGFFGDYSSFDATANAELIQKIYRITNAWYNRNDKDNEIRRLIFIQLSQSTHHFRKWIYQTVGCIPSGNSATVNINSILNELYLRISWLIIMNKTIYRDLHYYRKLTRSGIVGDDNAKAVHPAVIDLYNAESVAEVLSHFGITYADVTKDGTITKKKKIMEGSFLKNGFGKMDNFYVPLMDDDANLETLNWIRVGLYAEDPDTACYNNCNNVLRNLFFYGQERFNEIRQRILEIKPEYNLINFRSLQQQFYEQGCIHDPFGTFSFGGHDEKITNPEKEPFVSIISNKIITQSGQIKTNMPRIEPSTLNWAEEMDKVDPITDDTNTTELVEESGISDDPAAIASMEEPETMAENAGGAVLVTQSIPAAVAAKEGQVVMAKVGTGRGEFTLNDRAWTLDDMLQRINYVETLNWPLTKARGDDLIVYDVPMDLIKNDIASTPFTRFQKWKGSAIKVRLQMVANAFTQGRVVISFVPTMVNKTQLPSTYQTTLSSLLALQNAQLDPSESTTVDFTIPFAYFKTWLDLPDGDCLGQLYVRVLSPLQSASTGPTSVSIKVFSSVSSNEFKIPLAGGSSLRQLLATRELEALGYEVTRVKAQSGFLDTLSDIVDKVIPANLIGDAIGGLLDKPQIAVNPEPVISRQMPYLGHSANIDYVDKLQLYPKGQTTTDKEHFLGGDEMDWTQLIKQKKSLLGTVPWSTKDAIGYSLFHNWVGPMALGVTKETTLFDFVTSTFQYWRGSIDLYIDIVASKYQEGRLDVTYHPNSIDGGQDPDYAKSLSQYNTSIQLKNGKAAAILRLPYLADTPWRRVWNGVELAAGTADNGFRFQNFFNGSLSFRVGAPLTCPTTVVPQVDINMYIKAGPDFQLYGLGPRNSSLSVGSSAITARSQSGNIEDLDLPLGDYLIRGSVVHGEHVDAIDIATGVAQQRLAVHSKSFYAAWKDFFIYQHEHLYRAKRRGTITEEFAQKVKDFLNAMSIDETDAHKMSKDINFMVRTILTNKKIWENVFFVELLAEGWVLNDIDEFLEYFNNRELKEFAHLRQEPTMILRPPQAQSGKTNGGGIVDRAAIAKKEAAKKLSPVSNNTPIAKSNFITLCAGTGLTSDPRSHHFPEQAYGNMRDVLKRYQPATRFALDLEKITNATLRDEITAGSRPFIVPISNCDFSEMDDANLPRFPMLHKVARMYRQFRGPLNFKARVRPAGMLERDFSYTAYFTFLPDAPSQSYDYIQSYAGLFPAVNEDSGKLCRHSTPPLPLAYGSEKQVAEFSVPYSSLSPAAMITQSWDSVTESRGYAYQANQVIMAIWCSDWSVHPVLDLYCAIGDEAHMGTFIGVPQLTAQADSSGKSLAPDAWLGTTSKAFNQLRPNTNKFL
jgi:hypothetical protein